MTHRLFAAPVLILALSLVAGACGNSLDTGTPTSPTTPTTITETFSDTLNKNGGRTHDFTSQASGTLTATLTLLEPDSTLVVGFSAGTWNGSSCQIVLANDKATQGTVITGGVSSFGSLCVRIYDVGNITEPVTYEITVVHP